MDNRAASTHRFVSRTDAPPRAASSDAAARPDHWTEIGELLTSLYGIVDRLEALFPGRKFTPDGHLVGSIGEVIAARMFGLELLPASAPGHDARAGDGRRVQIKFTQGMRTVALRAEPEHLLVLRLAPDRSLEVVYNGKGALPWSQSGKVQSNGQRPISLSRLRAINRGIPERDRLVPCAIIDLAPPDRQPAASPCDV